MTLSIRRPIAVKAIVTDKLKHDLLQDVNQAQANLDIELQQLEFQGKKLLADFAKQAPDQLGAIRQQIEAEREKRLTSKQELTHKAQAIAALELDQEILHSTVEGDWTVQVGHNWDAISEAEIVLKDGIVVEIREVKM